MQGTICSYGTLTGRLEAIVTHPFPAFWLHPGDGQPRVYCTIPDIQMAKMLDCAGRLVRVLGKKVFSETARLPERIEASDFSPIEAEQDACAFIRMRGVLGSEESSMESLRRLRDEWE